MYKPSKMICPKCKSCFVKFDQDGPYFCGTCEWERGRVPIVKWNTEYKIKRNDPCKCGKLKDNGEPIKYKNCCGK